MVIKLLARNDDNRYIFNELNALPLVANLINASDSLTAELACAACSNLVLQSSRAADKFIQLNGCDIIVRLLSNPSLLVRESFTVSVLTLILNICDFKPCLDIVAESRIRDVIKPIKLVEIMILNKIHIVKI